MNAPLLRGYPHLAEVVPSALAACGVPEFTDSLGFGDIDGACVLLIDGLGWQLLADYAAEAPTLHGLSATPLRVGFPATTVAGLAAIGTGAASGEHGMAGYSFELPDVGVVNALRWCTHPEGGSLGESVMPEHVQPMATTFDRARAAGVEASVVSAAQFQDSALTRATLRGGRYQGVYALGDLAATALDALGPAPSLCYAYHSELDLLGHLYGPGSAPWLMQLRQVDRLVESIVEQLPPGRLLAVVADHGMVAVDDTAVDLDATAELRTGVRAIGGEVRARHLYVEHGAGDEVLAAWRETLGGRAWVASKEQAIEDGWFGPRVAEQVRPRLGDVVAAARERFGMLRRTREPAESALVGQHGSMTSEEQLVPLAIARG